MKIKHEFLDIFEVVFTPEEEREIEEAEELRQAWEEGRYE